MNDNFSIQLGHLKKQYEDAADRVRAVSHVLDHEFMKRAATEGEIADFAVRRKAMENALHRLCALPCPDYPALKSKAKVLNGVMLEGVSLSHRDQKALITSIFQTGKA